MLSAVLVILALSNFTWQVSSQANINQYSDQQPWTFVYTLYPYYNYETLFEIWKAGKAIETSANLVTLPPTDQEKSIVYTSEVDNYNETTLKTQGDTHYVDNESENTNVGQLSKNRQRLSGYRNRRKDSSLQNE